MSARINIIVCCVLVVVVLVLFYVSEKRNEVKSDWATPASQTNVHMPVEKYTNGSESDANAADLMASINPEQARADFAIEENNHMPHWITDEGMYEISEFLRRRGHSLILEGSDINNYDIQTLEALRLTRDIAVFDALGRKYHENGNREKAYEAYLQAAVYGSSNALGKLATFHTSAYYSKPEEKQHLYAALAFHQVAALRGDHQGLIDARILVETNGVILSENDRLIIASIAENIYQKLESDRSNNELEPFDNHVPDTVRDYYSVMN